MTNNNRPVHYFGMARTRNNETYEAARSHLLSAGLGLIRSASYESVGIAEILKESGVPKGSFYHYFDSKETFGLEVARFYHAEQMAAARAILRDKRRKPQVRLRRYFESALEDYTARDFGEGCLMCNLSTELADENTAFQTLLKAQWRELSAEIAHCMAEFDHDALGFGHLSNKEAADWLLNAWSGALTRMKAERNATPLRLFVKSVFKQRKST